MTLEKANRCDILSPCSGGFDSFLESGTSVYSIPNNPPTKMRRAKKNAHRCTERIVAVDLFCGAGGLTKGLEDAGIEVTLGVDLDPACEFPYGHNNRARFLLKSVAELQKEDLMAAYGEANLTLLAGCAPCQPFSTYRLGKSDETDGRWHLLQQFQSLALQVQPSVITMENVPRLAEQAIFKSFVRALTKAGYFVEWRIVSCMDYGVPQQRERLVLLASKLGPISLIQPTHLHKRCTVRKTIGNMPVLAAGQGDKRDPLHRAAGLASTNLERIKASVPGGTWRDWSKDLVAECHRKASGKTYPSVYGRMSWDEPAPTMTTQFYGFGSGRFGHPEQDRAISLREGALLQSFPKRYRFTKPKAEVHYKTVGRLIGNAVPVKLAKAIGLSIIRHIELYTIQVHPAVNPSKSN